MDKEVIYGRTVTGTACAVAFVALVVLVLEVVKLAKLVVKPVVPADPFVAAVDPVTNVERLAPFVVFDVPFVDTDAKVVQNLL